MPKLQCQQHLCHKVHGHTQVKQQLIYSQQNPHSHRKSWWHRLTKSIFNCYTSRSFCNPHSKNVTNPTTDTQSSIRPSPISRTKLTIKRKLHQQLPTSLLHQSKSRTRFLRSQRSKFLINSSHNPYPSNEVSRATTEQASEPKSNNAEEPAK